MAGAYRKDQLGRVNLRGLVTRTAGAPMLGAIAVLPAGYRPPAKMLFTVGGGEAQTSARLDVHPDGQVIWFTGPVGEPDYTSLDQIAFWPG